MAFAKMDGIVLEAFEMGKIEQTVFKHFKKRSTK